MMKTDFLLGHSPTGFHKLAVHVWGAAHDSQVPIICVHGLTRNARDFDCLAESLYATRPVYCPDVVGRGLSDNLAEPLNYNFTQYVADAVALIARTSASQVDWVGTSMGGIVGMLIAAQPNSPIRRLVLNDVGPFVPKETVDRLGSYLKEKPPVFDSVQDIKTFMMANFKGYGLLPDALWHAMAEHGHRRLPDGRLMLAYDPEIAAPFRAEATDVDLWSVYNKVKCPTLLLRGEASELLPRALAEQMTRTGPCAKLVEIEGTGHAPSLMVCEQIQIIQDFLKG